MDADKETQAKKKIDPGTIARQQLANRFKRTINASLFSDDEQKDDSVLDRETQIASETIADTETQFAGVLNKIPQQDDRDFPDFTSKEQASEMLAASKNLTSESIATPVPITSETLATNENLTYKTLATSETLAVAIPSTCDKKMLVNSETQAHKTEVDSETQVDKTLTASKTQANFHYGEKIPDSLFLLVLDYGFYDLLKDQVSAAPIIFYWAFTTQQSSVLRIVYEAEKALNLPPTRISRAIERIRNSDNFEVKNLKKDCLSTYRD
jgi:hypothetical protein